MSDIVIRLQEEHPGEYWAAVDAAVSELMLACDIRYGQIALAEVAAYLSLRESGIPLVIAAVASYVLTSELAIPGKKGNPEK